MGSNSRRVLGEETGFTRRQYPRGGLNSPDWDERMVGYACPDNHTGLGSEEYLVALLRDGDDFYFGVDWVDTSVLSDKFDYIPAEELLPEEETGDWSSLVDYFEQNKNLEEAAEKYITEYGEHLARERLEQGAAEAKKTIAAIEDKN